MNRIQNGQIERIIFTALHSNGDFNDGLGSSGGTQAPQIEIQRKSDGNYLDFNDNTFKSSGWTTRQQDMSELDTANSPGAYFYDFDTSGFSDDEYFIRVDTPDAFNSPAEGYLKVGDFIDNIDTTISSRSSHSADDVWTSNASGVGRTLTDFGTLISDVWSYVTRTLTGIGSSGIASESNATSNKNDVITEVDTNETKIDALPDENAIADQVWDEDLSGHTSLGSAGKSLQDTESDISSHRTAVENNIKYILGLVQSNTIIDNQVYDSNDNLTSARIRIFPSNTDVDNETNVLKIYTMTATYDSNGLLNNYEVKEN